jgi:hypothetical protein
MPLWCQIASNRGSDSILVQRIVEAVQGRDLVSLDGLVKMTL